jgi:hypothetical protein
LAGLYGANVVCPLIKQKKYREGITEYMTTLRTSKVFRDRQMYLHIATAAFHQDQEVFKKHFAKSIGLDLINEPCKLVQITLAQHVMKIPQGFSRSTDKVREHLLK